MTNRFVIVGASGHGRELFAVARDCFQTRGNDESCAGFLDDGPVDLELVEELGVPFLGAVSLLESLDVSYVIGIGDPKVRRRIDRYAQGLGRAPLSLIHPSASIGPRVQIGEGVVVAQGVVVTTNVRLGRHVHLNVRSSVSHDCSFGPYATVSPGATVCGAVTLGEAVYVGAAACVLQGRTIGDEAVVGAGSLVTRDVAPLTTVVGVPARPIVR